MKLKLLEIYHTERYHSKPTGDKYTGKVEFFNEKGNGLTITLTEQQLEGIVGICAQAISLAADEAAKSIIASLTPSLQLEQEATCAA